MALNDSNRQISAAVVVEEAKILLVREGNPKQVRDYMRLNLPGGKVRPNENPAYTAQREALEETGLIVEPKTELVRLDASFDGRERFYYRCCVKGGTLRAGHNIYETPRWVTLPQLLEYKVEEIAFTLSYFLHTVDFSIEKLSVLLLQS